MATAITTTASTRSPRRSKLPAFAGAFADCCSVMAAPGRDLVVVLGVRKRVGGRGAQGRAITDIPPAAAERAEQCRGIGEALCIGRHLCQRGILVLLLGGQYLQLRVLACAVFRDREVLARTRGIKRTVVRGVAIGVMLQGLQSVSHLHECADHGAVVARERLRIALLGFVSPGRERAAVEQRGCQPETGRPDAARLGEEIAELAALLGVLRRKTQLRQAGSLGYADPGAGRVQALLCREDVRTLLHQRRWQ